MLYLALAIYAAAMTAANFSIATFGPVVAPINAFFLIGLDLSLRDWLHFRLRPWQMLCLIAASGLLTYALNPAAGLIALASAVAFTVSASVDWTTFSALRGSWLSRANGSNVAGAIVDSLVFTAIASSIIGGFNATIVGQMIFAKIAGGAIWSLALNRVAR